MLLDLKSHSIHRIDQDILFAFRTEHAEAAYGGLDRQVAIKVTSAPEVDGLIFWLKVWCQVNLAALLLDIGNSRYSALDLPNRLV